MLESLTNSKAKQRLLNIFFKFPARSFTLGELRAATGARNLARVLRELARGEALRLATRRGKRFFQINSYFPLYDELQDLVAGEKPEPRDQVSQLLRRIDRIRLAVLSGIFTGEPHLPVDLLLVGDDLRRSRIAKIIAEIEKLIGQEINYVIMDPEEYDFRRTMSDRLVRDVIDNRHVVVFNSLKK
ncbi:MAG: hypothetical protein HY398_02630 [Candidatus Doudnabacteria bacterium]|nr:hypothetical protein [Candidatus Doudnabacteria bacterium]